MLDKTTAISIIEKTAYKERASFLHGNAKTKSLFLRDSVSCGRPQTRWA